VLQSTCYPLGEFKKAKLTRSASSSSSSASAASASSSTFNTNKPKCDDTVGHGIAFVLTDPTCEPEIRQLQNVVAETFSHTSIYGTERQSQSNGHEQRQRRRKLTLDTRHQTLDIGGAVVVDLGVGVVKHKRRYQRDRNILSFSCRIHRHDHN